MQFSNALDDAEVDARINIFIEDMLANGFGNANATVGDTNYGLVAFLVDSYFHAASGRSKFRGVGEQYVEYPCQQSSIEGNGEAVERGEE